MASFPTPEEAALAGCDPDHDARALAAAAGEGVAAVLLASVRWPAPDLALVRRAEDGGWVDAGATSGRTLWTAVDVDDVGALVIWSEAPDGAGRVAVRFRGRTDEVPAANGYFVWLREDVDEAAVDEDVEVTPAAGVPNGP